MKKICLLLVVILFLLSSACSGSTRQNTGNELDQTGIPEQTTNLYPGELLYNGSPAYQLLGKSIIEVIDNLGSPLEHGDYEGDSYIYTYDGIAFICDDKMGNVIYAEIKSNACKIDGVIMEKSRVELISMLGNPVDEGWTGGEPGGDGYYYLSYEQFLCSITICMSSPEDKSNLISIAFDLNKTASVEYVSINMPSTWESQYDEGNGGYVFFEIDCQNQNIDMSVYEESRRTADDVISYNFNSPSKSENFTYDDGETGRIVYDDSKILFIYEGENELFYQIDFDRDTTWYSKNKLLIQSIAKTLTFTGFPDYDDNGNSNNNGDSNSKVSADGYIIGSGDTVYAKGGGWSLMGSMTEGNIHFKTDGSWTITWVAVHESMGFSGWQRNEIYKVYGMPKFYSPNAGREMGFSPPNVSLNQLYIEPGNIT